MALENVAPLLAKEFVLLKLDYDRDTGAKDIERRYIDKEQGLPWFVFVDGDGKQIINSTAPATGNVGHPYQPNEIDYFETMLKKAQHHLTDADISLLIKILRDDAKKG